MIPSQKVIQSLHNGLFHCPLLLGPHFMPELHAAILACPALNRHILGTPYTLDVKVHMLMPGQWPCIPNWHYDMVPRDKEGKQDFSRVNPEAKMYLWLSGPPLTEFKDGRKVVPGEWLEFTQEDLHRGTQAEEHCWRIFMRAAPTSLVPYAEPDKRIRRHSQVYLDAENFKW